MLKLDYTITDLEQRKALVEALLAEVSEPSESLLESCANYLLIEYEKWQNHLVTIHKRETSMEGLQKKFQQEDGLYNLIKEDKNVIFRPKDSITPKDLEEIPELRQLREGILAWEKLLKKSSGRQAYVIKKALIEMRKDQYLIRDSIRKPIVFTKVGFVSATPPITLIDESRLIKDEIVVQGFSLLNFKIVQIILANYSKLREGGEGRFLDDTWYLMEVFDAIASKALSSYPVYERIIEKKIDGRSNQEIKSLLEEEFSVHYTVEYISQLWRTKIPRLIAKEAKKEFVLWEFRKRNHELKHCSSCGQWLPRHSLFFSRNRSSPDGWYTVCKACRKERRKRK